MNREDKSFYDTYDYSMERRLQSMSPDLHKRFTDAVFGVQNILSDYQTIFPGYTDHSERHSLTVIEFCNKLIADQIERLNEDEMYVLLVGCYFHDTGMGTSLKDYEEFLPKLDLGTYPETHDMNDTPSVIRDFHNELSGLFIRKYEKLFDIPSKDHLDAIIQIARGHRKTDLMDEDVYPISKVFPSGNTVCYPYLSALIRLADEIDMTSARNSPLLYHIENMVDEEDIMWMYIHEAIPKLEIRKDSFVFTGHTEDPVIEGHVRRVVGKMQKTLDICRKAVTGRTPYEITQEKVLLKMI